VEHLVTIAFFSNPIEANIKKTRLESEGITCFLADENMVSIIPIYSLAVGNIKLKVPENEASKALEILQKNTPEFVDNFTLQEETEDKMACPNCFSQNTYKEDLSKKSILSYLLLGFPIPIRSNKFHCFECGYQWKKKKT